VAPKKAIVKKDVESKVVAKNGCDGRLIAKISQWPSWGLHTFLQLGCFGIRLNLHMGRP